MNAMTRTTRCNKIYQHAMWNYVLFAIKPERCKSSIKASKLCYVNIARTSE